MVKAITYHRTLSIIAALFIVASIFSFIAAPVYGQTTKPATSAAAPTLTSAEEAQLLVETRKPFSVIIQLVAAELKKALGLKEGETVQISASVRTGDNKTALGPLPLLAERHTGSRVCFYLPDGITFKEFPKMGGAASESRFAQALRNFLGGNRTTIEPFDANYPSSFCANVKGAFRVSAQLLFDENIGTDVVGKNGAEIVQAAKAAACPKNIETLVRNIETRCAKNPNAANCRVAGQNALKAQLAKNPKTAQCDLSSFLTSVTPATQPAPGRPEPGKPGNGTAVPPIPPSTDKAPAALFDFGDARPGFPTLRSENGPRHVLSNRVWLGELIDGENDGLRTNVDDATGADDEDGMLQSNPQFILRIKTGRAVASTVYVNAWEDWNANGRWDINANGAPGDEWIVRNQPVRVRPNSTQDVALIQPRTGPDGQPLPAAWSDPAFWLRFTVTETRIANGNPALGQKPSGETEDYIGVAPPVPSAPTPAPAPDGASAGAAAGH